MQPPTPTVYSAAHREVEQLQRLLKQAAEAFDQTFTLSMEEIEELNGHAELHAVGPAIEFFLSDVDVTFSLGAVRDPDSGGATWELVAFEGTYAVAQPVMTMRHGPTASEGARRTRGARLIAAIGAYLEQRQRHANDAAARAETIAPVCMEQHGVRIPPQLAAYTILQPA